MSVIRGLLVKSQEIIMRLLWFLVYGEPYTTFIIPEQCMVTFVMSNVIELLMSFRQNVLE